MLQALWSWESAIVAALLVVAVLWAARPVQTWRIDMPLRAFREDIWRAMVMTPGSDTYLDFIDRYEFDEGSDHNGVMVLKNGMRLRFETYGIVREGEVWTVAWRSVELAPDGAPTGDPYETAMELRESAGGTAMTLRYAFFKGERVGWKAWLGRILRPMTRLQSGWLIRSAVDKAGGFKRFDEAHGRAPTPAMVAGVPMTRTSLVLFGLGAASFIWMSGLWTGVALLVILVLHELGHVLAMRAYGDRASAFYLIPFMGGVAIGQKPPPSDWHLILLALAGPFAGLLTVLAALGLFEMTDNHWWLSLAVLAAIINLLNLLPIPILDGGQVLMALFRRYLPDGVTHWVGVGLMTAGAAGAAWLGSTLLMVLFALLAVTQAAFPMPQSASGRVPLSHAKATAGAALLVALAAALLLTLWLMFTGDAYPPNPMRFLGRGPFT